MTSSSSSEITVTIQPGSSALGTRIPYEVIGTEISTRSSEDYLRFDSDCDVGTTEFENKRGSRPQSRSRFRDIVYIVALGTALPTFAAPVSSTEMPTEYVDSQLADEATRVRAVLNAADESPRLLDSRYDGFCIKLERLAADHREIPAEVFDTSRTFLDHMFLAETLPARISATGDHSLLFEFRSAKGRVALLDIYPANEVIFLHENADTREIFQLTYSDSAMAIALLEKNLG